MTKKLKILGLLLISATAFGCTKKNKVMLMDDIQPPVEATTLSEQITTFDDADYGYDNNVEKVTQVNANSITEVWAGSMTAGTMRNRAYQLLDERSSGSESETGSISRIALGNLKALTQYRLGILFVGEWTKAFPFDLELARGADYLSTYSFQAGAANIPIGNLTYNANINFTTTSAGDYSFYFCYDTSEWTLKGKALSLDLWEVLQDNTAPVIKVTGDYEIVSSWSNPISIDYIKSKLKVEDNVDSNLVVYNIVDNFTPSKNILGRYLTKWGAKDKAGNEAVQVSIYVNVLDTVVPSIVGPNTITSFMSNPLTNAQILAMYQLVDDYDGTINNRLAMSYNGFAGNEQKKGNFSITLSGSDLSGNTGIKYIEVQNKDDIAPVITGPTKLGKSVETNITINDIKASLFTALDNVDGGLTLVTENDGGYKKNTVGVYNIVFSATDSSNNKTLHYLEFTLYDDIPPIIYLDNSDGLFLSTFDYQRLTKEQIIRLVGLTQNLNFTSATIDTTQTYFTASKLSGEYEVFIDYEYQGVALSTSVIIDAVSQKDAINYHPTLMDRVNEYRNYLIAGGSVIALIIAYFIYCKLNKKPKKRK